MKLRMPLTDASVGKFSIVSNLARSTSIPFAKIQCLRTIPSRTMK